MKLYKSQSYSDLKFPDLNIIANEPVPDNPIGDINSREKWNEFYQGQADYICKALRESLPGGTWDRLVAAMIREHASLLMVKS